MGYGYLALVDRDFETAHVRADQAARLAPVAPTLQQMVARFRADLERTEAKTRTEAVRP